MKIAIAVVVSYFIGAIPVGYIIGRLFFKTDITKKGSGNIGFANVAQFLGLKAAFIVFMLDFTEGFIAVIIFKLLFHDPLISAISAFFVVLGHDFSVFMHFKGGKGASTTYGALAALAPLPTLLGAITFFIVLAVKKYISLSNLISICLIPIYMVLFSAPVYYTVSSMLLAFLLIYTHRVNIANLRAGLEIKITDSNPLKKKSV
jgi:glycerol-3-phosphate acyltransferase PlsY